MQVVFVGGGGAVGVWPVTHYGVCMSVGISGWWMWLGAWECVTECMSGWPSVWVGIQCMVVCWVYEWVVGCGGVCWWYVGVTMCVSMHARAWCVVVCVLLWAVGVFLLCKTRHRQQWGKWYIYDRAFPSCYAHTSFRSSTYRIHVYNICNVCMKRIDVVVDACWVSELTETEYAYRRWLFVGKW